MLLKYLLMFKQDLDASQIEIAALRAALRLAASDPGVSVLNTEGTVLINPNSTKRPGPTRVEEIEDAYGSLERQSRELAKQNRAARSV